jgi:hypothetical protein
MAGDSPSIPENLSASLKIDFRARSVHSYKMAHQYRVA